MSYEDEPRRTTAPQATPISFGTLLNIGFTTPIIEIQSPLLMDVSETRTVQYQAGDAIVLAGDAPQPYENSYDSSRLTGFGLLFKRHDN